MSRIHLRRTCKPIELFVARDVSYDDSTSEVKEKSCAKTFKHFQTLILGFI